MRRRHPLGALVLLVLTVLGGACPPQGTSQAQKDTLVVFAAASLRDALTLLSDDFERSRPGVQVVFSFAGSQELRAQLEHGAAVDVFASADMRQMDELVRTSLVSTPIVFARNELVIVVAPEANGTVRSLADLPDTPGLVVGVPEVPIGRYTLQLLDRAGARHGSDFRPRVEANVWSRELNARQVLARVSVGEALAGIVYRTDALLAQGHVAVVPIGPELNVMVEYPVAVVNGAGNPALARAWIDFLLSPAGQRALAAGGFLPAPSAGGFQ